jgi:biotin carboxyl carrier protein
MSDKYFITYCNGELWIENTKTKYIHIEKLYPTIDSDKETIKISPDKIISPVPGIVREVLFSLNDSVEVDNVILTIESMKTYFELKIGTSGIITKLNATIGDQVAKGDLLVQVSDKLR